MKIGFIGLGKMGKGIVTRLLKGKIDVVVWNRSWDDVDDMVLLGATAAKSHEDLITKLITPRIIWLMVPQGDPVDEMITSLIPYLDSGDLVIDGGNSFYKDTLRRSSELSKKGIRFMDAGVSGGPGGALNGACVMIGGNKKDYDLVKPILKIISAQGAYEYLGGPGAGHFAKMVHNGIEYGMMEAIAEGAAILAESDYKFDLAKVFKLYNSKSVIESRLVAWAKEAFEEDQRLKDISSKIEATGEGEWTVKTAEALGVEVPVIKRSLQVRQDSVSYPENYRNKVVSALRGKFGGHMVRKS